MHTPLLVETNAGSPFTHSFYFGCVDKKGGAVPIYGKTGGSVPGAGQPAATSGKDVLRVTHVRDSIDARDGGVWLLNIMQAAAAEFTWGYC